MPAAAAVPLVAAGLGAGASIYAANKSAKAVEGAADQATQAQLQMYEKMREDLAPYRAGGSTLFDLYVKAAQDQSLGDRLFKQYEDYLKTPYQGVQDPSIKYIMEEARKATERGAAAKGGLLSGGVQKALQKNAANIGSTYWQQGLQNYYQGANALKDLYATGENKTTNYLQRLLSGAGLGENAAAATGAAGMQAGTQMGNNALLAGLAQGNLYTSYANTGQNLLNTIANQWPTRRSTYSPVGQQDWYDWQNQYSGGGP